VSEIIDTIGYFAFPNGHFFLAPSFPSCIASDHSAWIPLGRCSTCCCSRVAERAAAAFLCCSANWRQDSYDRTGSRSRTR
jgi:hypothetical protein